MVCTPLKHVKVSWDAYSQTTKNMFQTTNQIISQHITAIHSLTPFPPLGTPQPAAAAAHEFQRNEDAPDRGLEGAAETHGTGGQQQFGAYAAIGRTSRAWNGLGMPPFFDIAQTVGEQKSNFTMVTVQCGTYN